DQVAAVGAVIARKRAGEHQHVGDGEVHAFGTGRRLDMRGVAGQEQPAVLHRLRYEAAHGGDALLQETALGEPAGAADGGVKLMPDAFIGPGLNVIVGRALHVEARQARRAHGVKREAALVIGIDQLVVRRRRFRENADPAKRILAIVFGDDAHRNARPANAVKAVAAADEIAVELLRQAGVAEADLWRSAGEVVDAYVLDLEQDLPPVSEPPRDEVLHHLLLAVDGDALSDQLAEVDVVQRAVEAEVNPVVEHRLAPHALADAGVEQEIGGPLLQQPGADAAFDIVAAAVLQDDGLDPFEMQKMREHEARRASADNPDLGAQAWHVSRARRRDRR